jgi:tetratricopeptide (TPR) repeat protein
MADGFQGAAPSRNGLLGRLAAVGLLLGLWVCALGPTQIHAQAPDSTELRQFNRAESLLESGQTEQAIGLLESLYDQAPAYDAFYETLKEAYEQTKQYEAAIELVNDQINAQAAPPLLAEKGRLLYQSGQRDRASATWDEALALRPQELSTYRVVYQTLMDLRLFSEAIDVLTKGRSALDRPGLFRTDLAYLYSLDGQHGRAMEEYVALLAESPDRVSYVRERLQSFVDREEGLSTGIEVLESAVEERPSNAAYPRLLAWLHMQSDDYAAAFDVVQAVDRLQEQQGRALLSFAGQAGDAEEYAVATKAYEAVLDRHAEGPVAPQARKGLGDMYRRWADRNADTPALVDTSGTRARRYDAARTAYRTFLDEYPDHEAVPDVRIALGTLQLDVYRDLTAAEATFQGIIEQSPSDPSAQTAALQLGRIALLRGAFEEARSRFSRLATTHRSSEVGHQAQFELARLEFYQGAFDAALERTQTVTTNTSTDVSNDAIDLKVLIQENRGPDSLDTALRLYAQARLAERKRAHDTATAHLDSLLQTHPRHPLADEARFRRAHVHLAQGDTTAALQAFDDVPRQHPSSPYADRSLFRHAQLQEAQGDLEAATSAYDRLLTEYPQSLLAGDARTRLRTLRRQRG